MKDAGGDYRFVPGRSKGDAMNHDNVLAVLSDSKEEAKSIKEMAQAVGLEISSYLGWVRAGAVYVRNQSVYRFYVLLIVYLYLLLI